MDCFTDTPSIPWTLGLPAIPAWFLGAPTHSFGVPTRVAAPRIGTVVVVAALTVCGQTGPCFMDWTGQRQGEGTGFHPIVIAIPAARVVRGGRALSADRAPTGGRTPGRGAS